MRRRAEWKAWLARRRKQSRACAAPAENRRTPRFSDSLKEFLESTLFIPSENTHGSSLSPDASTTGQFAQTDLSENSNSEAEEIRRPVALFQAILPGKPSGQEEKR